MYVPCPLANDQEGLEERYINDEIGIWYTIHK